MKRLLLFALLLLASGSCATRKASTSIDRYEAGRSTSRSRQQRGSQRQETTVRTTASEMTSSLQESLREMLSENLRVSAIFYDTDKPADSLSGKPPVLAEVSAQRERQNTIHQERNTDVHTSDRSAAGQCVVQDDSSRTELNASADLRATTKTTEKTKSGYRMPWWTWVIVIIFLGVIYKTIKWKLRF